MPDLNGLVSILATVLGVGFLIIAHEFGHFLAAKLSGVRVEIFSVGFGKPFLSWQKGDTCYQFCLVFIGGFVKMAGDPLSDRLTGAAYELQSKSVLARTFIYAAGPVASAIAGLFLFWSALQIGINATYPQVGYVEPDSPAARGGLQAEDVLLELDGRRLYRWEQFDVDIAIGGDTARQLVVARDGGPHTLTLYPEPNPDNRMLSRIGAGAVMNVVQIYLKDCPLDIPVKGGEIITHIDHQPVFHPLDMLAKTNAFATANPLATHVPVRFRTTAGLEVEAAAPLLFDRIIGVKLRENSNQVDVVLPDSTAAEMGITAGDYMVSVDDQPISTLSDLYYQLHLKSGNAFAFRWRHGDAEKQADVTLEPKGVVLPFATAPQNWVFRRGPVAALVGAWSEAWDVWRQIKLFFSKLFSADAGVAGKSIGGPIGIFKITYEIAKEGHGDLLFILAMISINLAIVNILPIPLLDGGQVMLVLLEGMKGSPLHPRVQDVAVYLGLVIILSLFLFATFNDLNNWILK